MNDLRQNFLADSLNKLDRLQTILKEDLNESERRELFRAVHTIKGGAQTFGLTNPARLAEEIENVLSNREILTDKNLLLESIERLSNSLRSTDLNLSADFIERLQSKVQTNARSEIFLTRIPPNVFKSFSQTEQNTVINALREGKNILCAHIGFEPADFAVEYRNLQKVLSEKSEIIAALPGAKFNSLGKIGFQLFLVSRETSEYFQKLLENYSAEIVSHTCPSDAPKALFEMLSQIAAHGENIAAQLGKVISITILTNETRLSGETAKAVFDILLQLLRNAVHHAFEKSGKIEIRLFDAADGLHLTFADDGNGVDLAAIRLRAVEKDLISDDDLLSDEQTLELIFVPELSTLETATEISGRGIGLDAVKDTVEKIYGKISVKSRKTLGTTFEIFLPAAEKSQSKR